MKIKNGFVIRKIANDWVVIPSGQMMIDFKAMVNLNETGAFLWENMKEDITKEELANRLTKEYDVDFDTAMADITEFTELLETKGIIE